MCAHLSAKQGDRDRDKDRGQSEECQVRSQGAQNMYVPRSHS
jgi:hypothetical protein